MMLKVLFVCLGNICRSPAGEGILRHKAAKEGLSKVLHVESCGLGDWHLNELADERMREASERRGVALTSRAQQFNTKFFDEFDYILAADQEVLEPLRKASREEDQNKIMLMTAFSNAFKDKEVPDPYYGGLSGFDHVLDMLEDASEGIIKEIKAKIKQISNE